MKFLLLLLLLLLIPGCIPPKAPSLCECAPCQCGCGLCREYRDVLRHAEPVFPPNVVDPLEYE